LTLRAPAKLNLCLYLGRPRDDGLHELRSLFCPITLSDRIVVRDAERDEVVCPEVEGPNIVDAALAGLRARGWQRGPVRVEIEKRTPVAAGLGGGSADAAAVLRLAREDVGDVTDLAAELGADVPSQIDPAFALVGGAGEVVEPLPPPAHFGVVLVPDEAGLSTAQVYAEADRLGLGRDAAELDSIAGELRRAAGLGQSPLAYRELLVNDLAEAALSLRPEIGGALQALRSAGTEVALVTGSGPTAFGIFEDIAAADAAAGRLAPRFAGAIIAGPDPER
jgi:4-diphosphocytidyl-2-C-methyl-D-erythritol kinase